jgi:hypothetical protein
MRRCVDIDAAMSSPSPISKRTRARIEFDADSRVISRNTIVIVIVIVVVITSSRIVIIDDRRRAGPRRRIDRDINRRDAAVDAA